MPDFSFASIPHVLDDDEWPFVLAPSADRRQAREYVGARYRRGTNFYTMEFPSGELWLRVRALEVGPGLVGLTAFCGPLFNEWWPLLRRAPDDARRPLLSSGARGDRLTVTTDQGSFEARVLPATEEFPGTLVMTATAGALTDADNLFYLQFVAPGVVKVALGLLGEYRHLVDPVPNIDMVGADGSAMPLPAVVATAAEMAERIPLSVAPS